ncbi:glycosyltransferase family 4 protein [Epilithonimonas caeni]|uniref:glycosyltransferase family 4 protein n=1 Tax=Epilithonimonas caeni TaxID=365343 RepID=UPI000412699E|nr:glycosyltransferase family 4 protein [Epilithonimonas caeni]
MIRLLYITNGINGSGGLERVLALKASYLAEHYNYNVTILSLNKNHVNPFYTFSPKINMLSIDVTGNPIQYFKSYKQGIQKIVDEVQPDIISVCDDGLKGFFIPSIIKTKAKLIYERHVSKLAEIKSNDGFLKSLLTKAKWLMMEKLGGKYAKFVVLTNGNLKEWEMLDNLMVIPNPLSFQPEESSSLDKKQVICVGKISYQKGQDLLLQAWELVNTRFPDWELHLYGKENKNFLDTRNLPNNVYYFSPEKNIQQKYLESSIYVMSSRFEGFGMVLIEAMACGLPCVSFDCDYGPSDIIQEGIDGYLVANGNISGLADRLEKLMTNEDLRKSMGQKAKENVKRFQLTKIADLWDNMFKGL